MNTWSRIGALALATAAALGCDGRARPRESTNVQPLTSTAGGADILTYHVDNARSGWNPRERVLTPANVRPETFGLVVRGADIEGEIQGSPLFASAVTVHDRRTNADVTADTVFVGTMDNHVYALDADDLAVMWDFDWEGHRPPSAHSLQECQSDYHIGVMSTPVISPDHALIYVVGRITPPGGGESVMQGFALRTRDGSIAARFRVGETLAADGATRVMQTYDGADQTGAPVRVTFHPDQNTQRGALLLQGNFLYVATGIICSTPGGRGWLFAYDVSRLSENTGPVAAWVPAPAGGAGMWGAGGPAGDGTSVFVTTGNGRAALRPPTPAAARSYGDSLVRLDAMGRFDPDACFNPATPATCGAGDQSYRSNLFMPRYAELLGREHVADDVGDEGRGPPDLDLGASSAMLLPAAQLAVNQGVDGDHRVAVVGGKDGFLYLVDRDHMGGIGPSPLATVDDLPNLVGSELSGQQLFLPSASGGMRSTPAYFESANGRFVYVIGGDEIGTRADAPRGLTALRIARGVDPTPDACAGQHRQPTALETRVGCSTIWGAAPRPTLQLAWSSSGPLAGASPFVSSNGNADGIVWITFERTASGNGRLQAYAADQGTAPGRVVTPLYDSERVADDMPPGNFANLSSPVVANGHVYVTGGFGIAMYGVIPARTVPPLPDPPPPPDCEPGVSWEGFGRDFMSRFCVGCHAEYRDVGFMRRRNERVANSILTMMNTEGSMPPVRNPPVPMPTMDERTRMAAWLRCGAPASHTRIHAGWDDVPGADGAVFTGDADMLDVNHPGVLSAERDLTGGFLNPYFAAVPDRAFAWDRAAPAVLHVPVPGAGRYSVVLYAAENGCAAGGACASSLNVSVNGTPWVTGLDVASAAGGARRVLSRVTTVETGATARLTIELAGTGGYQALEVLRAESCASGAACPSGQMCTDGVCVLAPVAGDAGAGTAPDSGMAGLDGGFAADGAPIPPGGDGGVGGENDPSRGCSCRTTGGGRGVPGGLGALVLVGLALARRRRRTR